MNKSSLPHPSRTMPAGARVCHRTFGLGRVLPAPTKGRGEALVEFESGAVSIVTAEDLVALPPEGFEPQFDSDGELMHYQGPTIEGEGFAIGQDWTPDLGHMFWLTPSHRNLDYFTTPEVRALVAALQEILGEGEGR